MMYDRTLDGLVAIVTGAGAGIGRRTAALLAQRGARLVVADIDAAAARRTADDIVAAGGEAVPTATDIAQEKQVAAMIGEAITRYGNLDILFNNAAITSADHLRNDGEAVSLDLATWDLTMDVNARGTWLACKYAIPEMIRAGGGSIINASSDAAIYGDMARTAYAASKAAVTTLTRYVASQFGRDGVRCNSIRPVALVERPISIGDDQRAAYEGAFALGRTGTAEDIAKVVAFLASPEAGWITGADIPVNGGFELGSSMWPVARKRYEATRSA